MEHWGLAVLRVAQPRAECAQGGAPQPPLRQRQCAQPIELGLHGRIFGNREVLHENPSPLWPPRVGGRRARSRQAALAAIR